MQCTYQQAYDKIIEAYHKNEIKPFDSKFCFCGTLAGGKEWTDLRRCYKLPYSYHAFGRMEKALFSAFPGSIWIQNGCAVADRPLAMVEGNPEFEEWIFEGMSRALDVLKQIHIERGEDVDAKPLVKRTLKTTA